MNKPLLKYYKLSDAAKSPIRGTELAACWDISACLHSEFVKTSAYTMLEGSITTSKAVVMTDAEKPYIFLKPGIRCLVPTGLIFDIPEGYSLRIHPRSGLAWKNGITVANCEGVIDEDYYHETFVMLINHSDTTFRVYDGDRIAQIELVPVIGMMVNETKIEPSQKSDREGGFGHTGV